MGRKPNAFPKKIIKFLGKEPDGHLAERFNISPYLIRKHRLAMGIKVERGAPIKVKQNALKHIGKMSDQKVAELAGCTAARIQQIRTGMKVKPHCPRCKKSKR